MTIVINVITIHEDFLILCTEFITTIIKNF